MNLKWQKCHFPCSIAWYSCPSMSPCFQSVTSKLEINRIVIRERLSKVRQMLMLESMLFEIRLLYLMDIKHISVVIIVAGPCLVFNMSRSVWTHTHQLWYWMHEHTITFWRESRQKCLTTITTRTLKTMMMKISRYGSGWMCCLTKPIQVTHSRVFT